ncbi:MAG: hypothetical protein WC123_03430 [Bacilli bacterium]
MIADKTIELFMKNRFVLLMLIIILSVAVRYLTATDISSGGDAFYKWFQVKRLIYGFSFEGWPPLYGVWNHHTARWAILLPVFIFQYIFGTNPLVYYLLMVTVSTVATLLVYHIAKEISGLFLAVTSSLIFIFFPGIGKIGSQLLPSMFSCVYLLGSLYFLLKFLSNKHHLFLFLSAILFFFAYSAKITNLFFIPAYLYALYKHKKYFICFIVILICLYVFETYLFWYFSDGKILFGKLECIMNGHLSGGEVNFDVTNNFLYFFKRWFHMPISWKILFFLTIVASFFIIFEKNNSLDVQLIVFAFFAFILLETFAIKGITPLKIAEPFRTRYLFILVPFMILITNYFIEKKIYRYKKTKFITYAFFISILPFIFNEYRPFPGSIYSSHNYFKKINNYYVENYRVIFSDRKEFYRMLYVFLDDKYFLNMHGNDKLSIKQYKNYYYIDNNIKNKSKIVRSTGYKFEK